MSHAVLTISASLSPRRASQVEAVRRRVAPFTPPLLIFFNFICFLRAVGPWRFCFPPVPSCAGMGRAVVAETPMSGGVDRIHRVQSQLFL